MDEAVRDLVGDLPAGVAVVAFGGYARRLLTPGSDVDLMVLHGSRRAETVAKRVAERLFYPFWDAGIPLGHAVRDVDGCVREARGRIDVACSLLDTRELAGDRLVVERLRSRQQAELSRRRDQLLEALAADAAERHQRFASCATSLEPELKEGAGGLRDLHAAGWAQRIAGTQVLHGAEAERLDAAEEFLIRVRSALHLHTGRRTDRLLRDHQPELARAFGYDATAGLDGADALMRALFEHGRQVEHILDEVLRRAPGRRAPTGAVPATAAELLARLAEGVRGAAPDPALVDRAVEAGTGPPAVPWPAEVRSSFLEVLSAGRAGARAIEAMDRGGFLVQLLPEWAGVRCRPQRDPYHRFPVDVHLVQTLVEAASVLDGPESPEVLGPADRDAVLLGALLHDVGKIGRGSHVAEGERVAAAILRRMDAPEQLADDVSFLVREHLLLSDTATRRDLSDPSVARGVAERVGTPRRLAMLSVLTIADAAATGPHASSAWRMGLVRELVGRVGAELADVAPVEGPARLELAAARQRLLAGPLGAAEARTWARKGERAGTWDLTVVARDRHGLLARIAGSLTLAGLSILAARADTTDEGLAIDEFTVEPAFQGDVDEERWRAVRSTLRSALEERISLDARVREKRAHYPPGAPDIETEVRVLNDVSERASVVEVEAADRLGLLYDIARAFEDLDLSVAVAKVATYGPRVVDTFYVVDAGGRKVQDEGGTQAVRAAISERLA